MCAADNGCASSVDRVRRAAVLDMAMAFRSGASGRTWTFRCDSSGGVPYGPSEAAIHLLVSARKIAVPLTYGLLVLVLAGVLLGVMWRNRASAQTDRQTSFEEVPQRAVQSLGLYRDGVLTVESSVRCR